MPTDGPRPYLKKSYTCNLEIFHPLHLVARGKAVRISSHARLETSMHGPCNTIDGPRHSMACKTGPVVEFRGPPRRSSGKTPKTVRFRPSGWSSPNNFKPTDVDTEGRDTHDYARQARACLKSFGSGHGCSATKPPTEQQLAAARPRRPPVRRCLRRYDYAMVGCQLKAY